MLERSGGLPDEEQRMLERNTQIDAVLERALDLREMLEGVERSIEQHDGFPVGRTSGRLHRRSGEILERFVPHFSLTEVIRERRGVELQVIGWSCSMAVATRRWSALRRCDEIWANATSRIVS